MQRVREINHVDQIDSSMLSLLLNKEIDALVIRKGVLLRESGYENISDQMKSLANNLVQHDNLSVYPLTYAIIHEKDSKEKSEAVLQEYFEEAKIANEHYPELVGGAALQAVEHILRALTNDSISLLEMEGKAFARYNIRRMKPHASYAIEIHCENSFLKQLNHRLCKFFNETLDIEEALSFYAVLQKDAGGDLLLFDKQWSDYTVDTGGLDELTRKNKHLFFKQDDNMEQTRLELQEGDMVVFRAAQIWHCIDEVRGNRDRVTIGGFIAPSKQDKKTIYSWS